MTPEAKALYSDYFTACSQKFTGLNPSPGLQKIKEAIFYSAMESAIGAERPQLMYNLSPAFTRLLFGLVRMMPRRLGDWARTKIMMLPNFN